jgi:hypothetical protein
MFKTRLIPPHIDSPLDFNFIISHHTMGSPYKGGKFEYGTNNQIEELDALLVGHFHGSVDVLNGHPTSSRKGAKASTVV